MAGTKRQVRPGVWELRVGAGPDPARPGRYLQVSRTFHGSETKANKALAALVTEVDQRRHRGGSTITVAALLAEWLTHVEPGLSPTTLRNYRLIVDKRLVPELGDIPLGRLTVRRVDAFYTKLTAEGLAPATVRRHHAVLRKAFAQAEAWEYVDRNVVARATLPGARQAEPFTPTVDQLLAVLGAVQDPQLARAMALAASTGLRRGEVCGLRWSNIDWDGGQIRIAGAIIDVGGKLYEKDTKTHKARRLDLDEVSRSVLERQAIERGEQSPRAFVFSFEPDGSQPVRPEKITKAFGAACQTVGLTLPEEPQAVEAPSDGAEPNGRAKSTGRAAKAKPAAHLHSLRHLHASLLFAAGVPVHEISERLGHDRVSTTTDIYGHLLQGHRSAAAGAIESSLGRLLGRDTSLTELPSGQDAGQS